MMICARLVCASLLQDAAFAFHIPDLEHIKVWAMGSHVCSVKDLCGLVPAACLQEAFESLDPDSNKSYETQDPTRLPLRLSVKTSFARAVCKSSFCRDLNMRGASDLSRRARACD